MKYARVENDTIIEIANGNPQENYHPTFAVLFSVEIGDDIVVGAKLVKNKWVNPEQKEISNGN